MNRPSIFLLGGRRRLVNLAFRPGLQLGYPLLLLAITSVFTACFLAHTHGAYGPLVAAALQEPWLRDLASEIRPDYFVVTTTLGIAYVLFVLGACLAATHRLFGPIVALQNHLRDLKQGEYSSRTFLRAGHPLTQVAEELNELSQILGQANPAAPAAAAEAAHPDAEAPGGDEPDAVDRLLQAYGPQQDAEPIFEARRASIAS